MFLCIMYTGISTSFLYYAVSTALPSIMKELSVNVSKGHWLTSAYSLGMSVTIMLNAYLSIRFRAKRLYLFAIAMMIMGSAVSLFTGNFTGLLSGRILQALGNGVSITLAQQVLYGMYPEEKRGYILGWYGFSICCTQAFTPVLAGILTDLVNWKMIFRIGLILLSVAFLGNLKLFQNVSVCSEKTKLSFGCFRQKEFVISVLESGLLFAIMMAGTTVFPIYLQEQLQMSATKSGMVLLPGAAAIAAVSPTAGKLYDRMGIRRLGIMGCVLLVISMIGIEGILLLECRAVFWIVFFFLVRGIGLGLMMMPLVTWGLAGVKQNEITVANSVLTGLRTVGGALGSTLAAEFSVKWSFAGMILLSSIMLLIMKQAKES